MLLLILFAFIAGVVTILSPCILPILPIVLSGSLAGGRKRPFGVVAGFIGSFTFFTLALTAIVKATGLSSDALRTVAVIVIFLFGLSLIIPQTQLFLEKLFTKLSGITPKNENRDGFFGGVLVGLSLGLIWAPCVGPILASVITLAVTSQVNFASVFITFAYALGSGLPMLAITLGGRQLLQKVPWLLNNTAKIQQVFGVLMMVVALGIYFNIDRQFQAYILQKFPQYGAGLTSIEQNKAVQNELLKLKGTSKGADTTQVKVNETGPIASDFDGSNAWVNSPPLSLKKELKGKVVLVDFWTYSCINCIRTFPYLKKWYAAYKDQGFVIVGVHAPEFEFEKKKENVQKAMNDFGLTYPVVQDNDLKIWSAYNNQFWPAHYLINKDGQIVYQHFGEGNYVETENAIRQLLKQKPLDQKEVQMPDMGLTPETYLGWSRAQAYVNDNHLQTNQTAQYSFSGDVSKDAVGLKGSWEVDKERIVAKEDQTSLSLNFIAHQVYIVLDKPVSGGNGTMTVTMDGKALPATYRVKGMSVDGTITVDRAGKYDVVDLHNDYGRHTIELKTSNGVQVYSFTFG